MANEQGNVAAHIGGRRGFPRPFGRYLLHKNISRGGMGEVFLATVRGLRTYCVIKTIRGDLTGDTEFIGRFADEAKITVRISHPNIIRVFDCGKVGGDYYIAMEHVFGKDLGDILDRAYERAQPMPPQFGLFIAREIMNGLAYAHNLDDEHGRPMRLVHRDVSPQNILVGFDGSVKIIDFGLARTELLPSRTQGALAVGKYGYMSPEQARHERIDGRADIYSTGVMLFEVFTGDRLVDEQDQATLWARVLNPRHKKPSAVISALPKEVDDLVWTSVATRPEDRFPDAKAVLHFIDGMKLRPANRHELVEYVKSLYPNAEYTAPAVPDTAGFEYADENPEPSVVIAMSEEGAESVFGRGALPVEWTRQFRWSDVKADLDRKRGERRDGPAAGGEGIKKARAPDVNRWKELAASAQEATVIESEPRARERAELRGQRGQDAHVHVVEGSAYDDLPTTIAATAHALQQETVPDLPIVYASPVSSISESSLRREVSVSGGAAIGADQFADEEATVMMDSPQANNPSGIPIDSAETVAPIRVIAPVGARPSLAHVDPDPAGTRRILERHGMRPADGTLPAVGALQASIHPQQAEARRDRGTDLRRQTWNSYSKSMVFGIVLMAIALVVLIVLLATWT